MTPSALSNETLLPCAHCGGEAVQSREADEWLEHYHSYFIRCRGCAAQSAKFHANVDDSHGAVQKAIAAWNRRSPAPITELQSYRSEGVRPAVYIGANDVTAYVTDDMVDTVRAAFDALPNPPVGEKVLPLYLSPSTERGGTIEQCARIAEDYAERHRYVGPDANLRIAAAIRALNPSGSGER